MGHFGERRDFLACNGAFPLLMAVGMGHAAVVQLLLAAEGVDVNQVNQSTGAFPLLMAVMSGPATPHTRRRPSRDVQGQVAAGNRTRRGSRRCSRGAMRPLVELCVGINPEEQEGAQQLSGR